MSAGGEPPHLARRLAWRLCRRPFANLAGDGARLHGGRWNSPGRPMVYLASTAALCVLEVRVHLDLPFSLIPEDYVLMTVDLDHLAVERVEGSPADPAAVGDRWLVQARTPLLEVPSAIVEEETNLLLNPLHPSAASAAPACVRPFSFDERLWVGSAR